MDSALAENKLLILYALKHVPLKLTKEQLSDLILECVFINYFDLMQYITELEKSAFLQVLPQGRKELLAITPQGEEVLELFHHRIKNLKKRTIDGYIKENISFLIKKTSIAHEIGEGPQGAYIATLKALEGSQDIVTLTLTFPTREAAERAVQNWNDRSSAIYELLYKELIR